MDFQLRRPYSAKSRLESAQPLTATSPVHKAPPARSHSQSGGGSLAQYNAERIQSLGDSARAHGSPSKTLKTRTTTRSQPQPRTDAAVRPPHSATCSSAFVRLLLVGVLFCWQGLVLLVLGLTLHTAKGINHQISLTGAYGVKLSLDQGWLNNLQDSRLSHNITTTGVSRTDVYALHASNTTFVRTTTLWTSDSTHSVTSLASGSWAVLGNDLLALNVTRCGGDTEYRCLDSNQDVVYILGSKGNSLVVLETGDGSKLVYAYEPRI